MSALLAAIEWDSPASVPWVILLSLAGFVFVFSAYRPQVRSVNRVMAWTLPLLRGVAVVALLLSILKPVVPSSVSDSPRGAVVMIVDTSRSMSVIDNRTPAARVALARAMNALPPRDLSAEQSELSASIDKLDRALGNLKRSQDEVRLAAATGSTAMTANQRFEQATVEVNMLRQEVAAHAGKIDGLAESGRNIGQANIPPVGIEKSLRQLASLFAKTLERSDSDEYRVNADTRAIADRVSTIARDQIAYKAAENLLNRLPANVPVYAYVTAPDGVSPLSLRAGQPAVPSTMPTDLYVSDARRSIMASVQRLGGQDIDGVVVFTDGRQTLPQDDSAKSRMPRVFPINVAADTRRPDRSVVIESAPARVFSGESATVRVRAFGSRLTADDVTLEMNGRQQKRRSQIGNATSPDKDDASLAVEFEVKPTTAGLVDLQASVATQKDELTTVNNKTHFPTRVLAEKLNIATYAGAPSWDFHYLRNALQRCSWAQLKDGILDSADAKLPLSPDEILRQDVIVLCDIATSRLDVAQWDALNRLVTQRGGSVVLMANDERVLGAYVDQPQAATLLPWRAGNTPAWRTWSGERPSLRVGPTAGASDVTALHLDDDAEVSTRRWQELPPLNRVLPLSNLKSGWRPLVIENESQAPVIAESRLGAGRVLFIGVNETWRWRMKVGERDQDRLLLQLVRHVADEPYAARANGASLDVAAERVQPGGEVKLRARLLDTQGNPSMARQATVSVSRDKNDARQIVLAQIEPEGTGRFEGRATDIVAGRYTFTLTDAQGHPGPSVDLNVEPDRETEMRDVSSDAKFMQSLADSTGGSYFTVDTIDKLPVALATDKTPERSLDRRSLWDSPQLFILVLACLATEWALRKQFGLA